MSAQRPPPPFLEPDSPFPSNLVDLMQEAVVTTDLDLTVLTWSKGAERMSGWTAAEAVGRRVFELVGAESSPAPFNDVLPLLVEAGTASVCDQRSRRDGTRFSADTTLVLLRDAAGAPQRILGVTRDVTRAHAAELALKESEERFRALADAAPVLIWLSGVDKLCTWFNRPWLDFTGRTMAEEQGNGWAAGVHLDDFERCLEVYVRAFDRREPFEMEYRLRRHDGVFRWILDHGVPRSDEQGRFLGYIGSCVDVTERREGQERVAAELARNEQLVVELRETLQHVKTLKGLLPICMHCHKIRDDDGYWARLEKYITERTDAVFSHALCPECLEAHYPECVQGAPPQTRTDRPSAG